MQKTAFIAIVGCPNVGKSSILNALLGEKVAIVSAKPQTTRTRIMGVLTEENHQFVFTDTPGLHRPRTKLGEHMARAVHSGMDGVDACMLVVDANGHGLKPQEEELLASFQKQKLPVILVLNKIDMLKDRDDLAIRILQFSQAYDFTAVVPCSATKNKNMGTLKEELDGLFEALPMSEEFFFPEDTLTDQPERVLAAELLREQLLRNLDQEIPHGVAVVIEKMREREGRSDLMDIDATIFCERETHKGMIIGKRGDMLKKISSAARYSLEQFLGCQVNLQCWVKVKEDWRNREGLIRGFGLE